MDQNEGSSHRDSSASSSNSDRNIGNTGSRRGIQYNSGDHNVQETPHSSFSSSQEVAPIRRGSIASSGTISETSNVASLQHPQPQIIMTPSEEEQDERRRNIKAIMKDSNLSQKEKSQKIQALMDGRGQMNQTGSGHVRTNRRGSMSSYCSNASSVYASSMAQVAADAACETSMYMDNSNNHDGTYVDTSHHTIRSFSHSSSTNNIGSYDYDFVVNNANVSASDNVNVATDNSDTPLTTTGPMGSYKQYHGRSKSLQDWTESDRINAAAHTTVFGNRIQHVSRLMEQSRPACEHYDRNCTIVAPCCGLAFGCRICHDECPVLPPPIVFPRRLSTSDATNTAAVAVATTHPNAISDHHSCTHATNHSFRQNNNDISSMTALAHTNNNDEGNEEDQKQQPHGVVHHNKLERRRSLPLEFTTERRPEDNHHLIDRFRIREVICRHCYTRQSSKTNKCINCSIQFGQYHCDICNLWMSDVESPYHCSDCGFCRVGGRDNFRHCADCGMCIDTLLFNDHNCKSGKYMSDCPICQEDLFSSRFASHEMPCGHAIHWHCFTELTSYDTRCPVCKKTVESPERMEATWNAVAVGIALQPVPLEMARMVNILCNDCESTNYNQRWHFLGVRCQNCYSFNTTVEQIVMQGPEAATYLDRLDVANAQMMGGVPTDISLPTRYVAVQNDQYAMDDDDDDDDDDDESFNETMRTEDDMEE